MEKLLQPNRMLGKHAIIDLSGCDSEIIRNCRLIHDTLIKAAEMAGLTVIGIMDHHFMPEGYTAVLMLEESHLSIPGRNIITLLLIYIPVIYRLISRPL
jgi:S-adenosylmethionine/arginine decarboxylase-like enzyme